MDQTKFTLRGRVFDGFTFEPAGHGITFQCPVRKSTQRFKPCKYPVQGEAEELCDMVGATNCGDVALPGCMLSFCQRRRFDVELAELVKFEAV